MLTIAAATILAVSFNTNSTMPPGGEVLQLAINWLMWILGGAAVIGLIIAAILLAFSPASSRNHEVGGKIIKPLLAVLIGSSAVLLVNAVM